jgi:hypothetical protein
MHVAALRAISGAAAIRHEKRRADRVSAAFFVWFAAGARRFRAKGSAVSSA